MSSIKVIFHFIVILFALSIPLDAIAQQVIPDEVNVNYKALEKSLREVLFDLSQETEVTIAFQEEILPGDSLINFSVKDQALGVVLDYLLKRHRVKYKIIGDQIVLIKDIYYKSKDKIIISGYLTDELSGESLVSANVFLYDKSQGTVSNEYGFYSFEIPKGIQRIYYSYLGYNNTIKELSLTRDTIVNIKLNPNIQLSEVLITDTKIIPKAIVENSSVEVLPLDRLNSILPVGGEPDVMRLAYSMPGVTSGADGFGGMSVRGGSTNQNLILYDGIPVYNANHLFGLFSIFNSNVIKSAKLYKGAFPSHYSGRLSSVLDIRTREGNNQRLSGDINVGLLTAKASIEGPIQKDRSSFLVSYRRSTVDPWISSIIDVINNSNTLKHRSAGINFYDFNTKLNFSLGEKSKVLLSYYSGNDNFDYTTITDSEEANLRDTDELAWDSGNSLATVRYVSNLSQNAFLNASIYLSDHTFTSFDHDRTEVLDTGSIASSSYDAGYYKTKINDLGFKLDFDFIPSSKHFLKLGLGVINHTFSPQFLFSTQSDNYVPFDQTVTAEILDGEISDYSIKGNEIELYAEDNIRLGQYTNLNFGLNTMFVTTGKTYTIFQPRILFNTGTEKYTFKLSWGRMGQYLHSLSNTGLGVPSDIWLPSTENLRPETSWILSMGHMIGKPKSYQIGLDFYYKRLQNVTRYGTGVLRVDADSDWDKNIPIGNGESYGAEFQSNFTILKKTKLNVSYTLSWTNRSYDGLLSGEKFRFRYDRRHVINASMTHKFNENVEFSSNFEYGSGTPITLPDNKSYNYIDENSNLTRVRIFSDINNASLPAYHRLDLGFNFYNQYKWGSSKLTLGVYNVYNKINPLYIDEVINSDFSTRYDQVYLFRILPTISYNVTF